MPLVSIVMATYNGIKYIPAQLDSLLSQTYPRIEIVITDDASTDGTVELLQSYAEKYATIHLLLNQQNSGYVKNFEKGMLSATGDLIAPCDQDDIWLPQKIERMVTRIKDNSILYCDSELINAEGEQMDQQLSQLRRFADFRDVLNYTVGNSAPGHAMLVKREIITEAIPFPTIVTHDFWLGFVATFSNGVKFLNEVLVQYRQHTDNVFGAFQARDTNGKIIKRKKDSKKIRKERAKERMQIIYEKCPAGLAERKAIFKALNETYQNFSLANNWRRMMIFFKYRHEIIAYKRRSEFRKWMYCLKLFFTIQ